MNNRKKIKLHFENKPASALSCLSVDVLNIVAFSIQVLTYM